MLGIYHKGMRILYREKGSLDQISIGYFEATRGYVIYAAPR